MKSILTRLVLVLSLAMLLFSCGGDDDDDTASDLVDDDSVDDDTAVDDDDDDDDSSGDDTAPPLEYPESCERGPIFSFDLSLTPMTVPFPNDLYSVADESSPSGRRVRVDADTARPFGDLAGNPWLGFMVDAYNHLTGFSTLADLYLPVGTEPAADSLPDERDPATTDSVVLIVDDVLSPANGELVPLVFEYRSPDLHVTPWVPLREKTHHLLVATRGLRPAEPGSCFRASQSMRDVWRAWVGDQKPSSAARYAEYLERLRQRGVAPEDVLAIADFTTGWITADLEAAVGVLDELAVTAPADFHDWDIVPDDDPRLWATAHAVFDVPIFKPDKKPWALDENGDPIVDHFEEVRAYFTLPESDATPAGQPYPIVLFEHGIFNDKYEMTPPFTTEIAAQGFAMVAIDAVCHGDRLPPGTGEIGQFFCFYDIFHPDAWRDNFRESVANLIWTTRALQSLADVDLDANGVPDFDVTHIYSLGVSFGSILGGVFSALDRNVGAYVLSASGAKISSIAWEGEAAEYFDWIRIFEGWLMPEEPITDFLHLVIDMVQAILDPADSANYVGHTIDDPLPIMDGYQPQVLQQGGAYDEVIGGPSGGWLCRAGGWPQMLPYVWDAGVDHVAAPYVGSAYYQFDTDEHTLLFDEDPLSNESRAQVFHFLDAHFSAGNGEIIDPLAKK